MIDIKDIEIGLVESKNKPEGKRYIAVFNGYVTYKQRPVGEATAFLYPAETKEVKGKMVDFSEQLQVNIDGQESPLGNFKLEINKKKDKDTGELTDKTYTTLKCSKANVDMFDINGPFIGFVNELEDGRRKTSIKFNEPSYNFWTDEEAIAKFNEQINGNLELKTFDLINNAQQITDEQLDSLDQVYTDFTEWRTTNFSTGKSAKFAEKREERKNRAAAILGLIGGNSSDDGDDDDDDDGEGLF